MNKKLTSLTVTTVLPEKKQVIFLTGASGVGKTTLLNNLKKKYNDPAWEFIHFDSIGVPSTEDMVKEFGSVEEWQRVKTHEWIEKMTKGYDDKEIIVMDGQANLEFIREGFAKQSFTNYKIILIDCEQDVMVKRLTDQRQQAWLASEDMKNWLKFLRNQAQELKVEVIDTSSLTEEEVVKQFNTVV